mgnify:CR=1 FL=1
MNKEQKPDIALQELEQKIDALIQLCQRLHEDNQNLKKQQKDIIQQDTAFKEKNKKAKDLLRMVQSFKITH